MIVELDTWEYEHAANVGMRRWTANWGKQNAKHYNDKSRLEDDRTASHAAAAAELAVAKATNQYWSGAAWCSHDQHKFKKVKLDVGLNIEVKRSRNKDDIGIQLKQVGHGMILFVARPVAPEFMTVDVWGWIDYDEAWELGTAAYGKDTDFREVNRRHLNADISACPRP